MGKSCVLTPKRGASTYNKLVSEFNKGELGKQIFLKYAINPNFIRDQKKNLELDADNVVTYDSLLKNKIVQEFIGDKTLIPTLEKQFAVTEDTATDFNELMEKAYNFNYNSEYRGKYLADVEKTDNGKLKIKIRRRTEESADKFNNTYKALKLNEKLVSIFSKLGVTVEDLSAAEVQGGMIGHVDFSKARNIASGFASLIRRANNKEGAVALTEEFTHLLVRIFKDSDFVQRALNYMKNNPDFVKEVLGEETYNNTREYYEGQENRDDLIAEEALGQYLKEHLIKANDEIESNKSKKVPIFQRLINWIKAQFKQFNHEDVDTAITDVDAFMNKVAKNILSEINSITREDVANTFDNAQFNALSLELEKDIELLKNIKESKVKLAKIKEDDSTETKDFFDKMDSVMTNKDEIEVMENIFGCCQTALSELKDLQEKFKIVHTFSPSEKFAFLRAVRMYNTMYIPLIAQIYERISDEESNPDTGYLKKYLLDDGTGTVIQISIKDLLKEVLACQKDLETNFRKTAIVSFAEMLRPMLTDELVDAVKRNTGQDISVEDLIDHANKDIGFLDLWLDSMADCSDTLMQLIDKLVSEKRNKTQQETIEFKKRSDALRLKAERKGITTFDWMFETYADGSKTGYYLREVNEAQFYKDWHDFQDELDRKYGTRTTGSVWTAKKAERTAWLAAHSASTIRAIPSPTVYRNPAYDRLTTSQKEIYDEFLELKTQLESLYPENKVETLRAIQIRKSGVERFVESMTSPSHMWENFKENVTDTFSVRDDELGIYGERKKNTITAFDGEEFLNLPVLYTRFLKEPNDLSTDVFSTLNALAYACYNFKNMDDIVDGLEVAKIILTDYRETYDTSGDNILQEKLEWVGQKVVNKALKKEDNVLARYKAFLESQIYMRYYKDGGDVHVPFTDKVISSSKVVDFFLHMGSVAALGFNFLANAANVGTGLAMQNIEMAAGEHFNGRDLLKADKAYASELGAKLAELPNRLKTNKLDLVFELLDIKQDFQAQIKEIKKKSWVVRLLGSNLHFIGQAMGDHWLYGRTAIAMCYNRKVLLDGREMSLWDALQVRNFSGDSAIKELNYSEIKELDGSAFDWGSFKKKIREVNNTLFGVYNSEDANAASRIAIGRALQQYRKWMKIQFNRRFQAGQTNVATDTYVEGYYRTLMLFMRDVYRANFQIAATYNKLSKERKANLRRCVMEMGQVAALWLLAKCFDLSATDRKRRPWIVKMMEYLTRRVLHETGGLALTPIMPAELFKTVKEPLPVMRPIMDAYRLVVDTADPFAYTETMKSGPYKGLPIIVKDWMNAPIPVFREMKQINKFTGEIDNSINFYLRSY